MWYIKGNYISNTAAHRGAIQASCYPMTLKTNCTTMVFKKCCITTRTNKKAPNLGSGLSCWFCCEEDLLQRRAPPEADAASRSRRSGRRGQAPSKGRRPMRAPQVGTARPPEGGKQSPSGDLLSAREDPISASKLQASAWSLLFLFSLLLP